MCSSECAAWADETLRPSICPACFIERLIDIVKTRYPSASYVIPLPCETPRKYFFLQCGHFWVMVIAQNDDFKVSFDSSSLRQDLASILPNKLVRCICRNINCARVKQNLHSSWNFISTFIESTLHWRRTLTNWSDVKYVFPPCLFANTKTFVHLLSPSKLHSSIIGETLFLVGKWSLEQHLSTGRTERLFNAMAFVQMKLRRKIMWIQMYSIFEN